MARADSHSLVIEYGAEIMRVDVAEKERLHTGVLLSGANKSHALESRQPGAQVVE